MTQTEEKGIFLLRTPCSCACVCPCFTNFNCEWRWHKRRLKPKTNFVCVACIICVAGVNALAVTFVSALVNIPAWTIMFKNILRTFETEISKIFTSLSSKTIRYVRVVLSCLVYQGNNPDRGNQERWNISACFFLQGRTNRRDAKSSQWLWR